MNPQPAIMNIASTGVTQQTSKKPPGSLIHNTHTSIVALYEEKLFILDNQGAPDSRPIGVLDLEFLLFKEN
jgi:hypothetical protein